MGKTEQELTEAKIPYEVGRSSFKHLARAQIAGKDVGSLKILFHRETKEILGIHCFGERAAEIIHIGQASWSKKAKRIPSSTSLTPPLTTRQWQKPIVLQRSMV